MTHIPKLDSMWGALGLSDKTPRRAPIENFKILELFRASNPSSTELECAQLSFSFLRMPGLAKKFQKPLGSTEAGTSVEFRQPLLRLS